MGASKELKEIVIESGHMAESLFERVNTGYDELTVSRILQKKIYFLCEEYWKKNVFAARNQRPFKPRKSIIRNRWQCHGYEKETGIWCPTNHV